MKPVALNEQRILGPLVTALLALLKSTVKILTKTTGDSTSLLIKPRSLLLLLHTRRVEPRNVERKNACNQDGYHSSRDK